LPRSLRCFPTRRSSDLGNSYGINEVDLQTDKRLNVIVKASARLAASDLVITPEMVAAEIEDMGVSTYDKALPYALELEAVAFDEDRKSTRLNSSHVKIS